MNPSTQHSKPARTRLAGFVIPVAVAVAAGAGAWSLSTDPARAAFPGSNGKIAFDRYLSGTGPTERKAIYVINPNGSGLRKLATGRQPNYSANGKKIVFVRPGTSGTRSVYTMNANGTDIRRLTRANALDAMPAWSPGGKRIVFVRARVGRNGQPGPGDIYVMNANGTDVRRLTRTPGIHEDVPAWSPNGKWIAYAALIGSSPTATLFVIRPNGTGKHLLIRNGDEPDWAPNGKHIAFDRGGKIFVMTAAGRLAHRVGPGRTLDGNNAAWSPDGTKIAFVGFYPPGGTKEGFIGIFVMNSNGKDVRQLTVGGKTGDFGLNDSFPAWQPVRHR